MLRLAHGRRTIEVRLPFVARGLSRRRLDAAILKSAAAAGAAIARGTTARAIRDTAVESTAGTLRPAVLMVASGKHELRGVGRDTRGCELGYVGFKTHWQLSASARAQLEGRIVVILLEGGYAGIQLIEGGLANLCLLIDKRRLAGVGGTWERLLTHLLQEPQLAMLLSDGVQLSPKALTIAGVPYGFLQRSTAREGFYRLGDQSAVIPSFCGEGMAIALRSAVVGASVVCAGGSPQDHIAAVRAEFARRLRIALAVQRIAKRDWSRAIVWHLLKLHPGIARHLAELTRVPH